MDQILFDTDVLLDFFLERQPHAEYTAQILDLCADHDIKGYTTPVIIANIYYILSKVGKHEVIVEKLKQLLLILDIVNTNKEVILNALGSSFKDFEDALQNYSALHNGNIRLILTRNLKDFKKSELGVMTPELYLKSISF